MAYGKSLRTALVAGISALTMTAAVGVAQAQEASAESRAQSTVQAQLSIGAEGEASVQDIANRVAAALAEQGYRVTEARTTLLGRLRIMAESAEARREVVVSSTTGAVLRDTIVEVFADARQTGSTADGSASATVNVDTTIDGSASASADGSDDADAEADAGTGASVTGTVDGSIGDGAVDGEASGSLDAGVSGSLGQ